MSNERILVVDDDRAIRLALRAAFQREKMLVTEAGSGSEALELLKKQTYHLIILDIMMQDMDGYSALQQMRYSGNITPVLILSGKTEDVDQVLGLGLGADDYLTKPFHVAILIQKAKALIRRSTIYNAGANSILSVPPFRFDCTKQECFKNGEIISFTARELALFRFLMEHPGQVYSKEQLYRTVWNDNVVDDNTITVYMKRIREKIEADMKNPKYIRTVRGIGYVFTGE